jgi:MFS transporter, ACS family, tartrate transporter
MRRHPDFGEKAMHLEALRMGVPLPSEFLSGAAAARSIAAINSIGNLGGFVGLYAPDWIKDATGSYEWALYFLAACALASAAIAYFALVSREVTSHFGAVPTVRP